MNDVYARCCLEALARLSATQAKRSSALSKIGSSWSFLRAIGVCALAALLWCAFGRLEAATQQVVVRQTRVMANAGITRGAAEVM